MQKELKVLIVTGQRSKIIHYQDVLNEWKIQSSSATNSFDAIKIFNKHFFEDSPFDFVMTEYFLSGKITGLGLAKLFSEIYPDIKILIFPIAELFEQNVMQEYDTIRDNMIKPDLSIHGLRKIIDNLSTSKRKTIGQTDLCKRFCHS